MSDPIEQLLEVEQQAKQIIAQARDQASETIESARAEAQKLIAEARDRSRAEAEEIGRRRQAEAEQDREAALRMAAEQSPDEGDVDEQKLRRAVDRIVKVIGWADTGEGQ